jgi:hypothetical protein
MLGEGFWNEAARQICFSTYWTSTPLAPDAKFVNFFFNGSQIEDSSIPPADKLWTLQGTYQISVSNGSLIDMQDQILAQNSRRQKLGCPFFYLPLFIHFI